MKGWIKGLLVGVLLIGGYYAWSQSGRSCVPPPPESAIESVQEFGTDTGNGNLVGIQPYMFTSDYATEAAFYAKIDSYFSEAAGKGWFNDKTGVVLPEYLGSWLITQGEKEAVAEAPTIQEAMKQLILSNIGPYLVSKYIYPYNDSAEYALFIMKSEDMAQTYNDVFSDLARKYQVTIVAGSIILSNPAIEDGRLVTRDGPLYSVAPVFFPDGNVKALAFKSYPVFNEQFIVAAPVEDLSVTDTAIGKLAVLICADAWYPQSYEIMIEKGAEVLAVSSYIEGDNVMEAPWLGYSGHPNAEDVDPADLNNITLGEAWDKYAMAGRLPNSSVPNGMLVCLRGQLWDLGSDGWIVVVKQGQVFKMPKVDGAALANLWL